jgi:hypothetical protein
MSSPEGIVRHIRLSLANQTRLLAPKYFEFEFEFWVFTPLSAISQLYHVDQF